MGIFSSKDIYSLNFIPEVRDFILNGANRIDQTIDFCALNQYQTIVVCPAMLRYHWKKMIESSTDKKVLILSEHSPDIPSQSLPEFVIINYEQLEKYHTLLTNHLFDAIILECSDRIKNPNSKRSQLVFQYFINTPNKFCVDDMIFRNNHRALQYYNQLKFLNPDYYTQMINIFRTLRRP